MLFPTVSWSTTSALAANLTYLYTLPLYTFFSSLYHNIVIWSTSLQYYDSLWYLLLHPVAIFIFLVLSDNSYRTVHWWTGLIDWCSWSLCVLGPPGALSQDEEIYNIRACTCVPYFGKTALQWPRHLIEYRLSNIPPWLWLSWGWS
jgi:hypothetical protein